MSEADTRAELIDPLLKASGWGGDNSKILREYKITDGKIQTGGRGRRFFADYILVYNEIKLAVIEAKINYKEASEGVAQAKKYATKLNLETSFSTNGKEIYQICLKTGAEGLVPKFPTPQELWDKTYGEQNSWREDFSAIPFETKGGAWKSRYYQEIAIQKTMEAIAQNKKRILLTLATGTGKTAISFQIVWKLFQTKWNLQKDKKRQPRILFLADRNFLADQAFNAFSPFPADAMVRIKPSEINDNRVPTNGSIFFTIFQSFMSGSDEKGTSKPYFGEYPTDYFDFIIVDECHRGGANDKGNWRSILEYFATAVQLGLTATPKRADNVNTYKYFGEPIYIYSLKEGIEDGFLTPFKVKRIQTTIDDYIYTDDIILEGEVREGALYEEKDFNKKIEIKERENKRVQLYMEEANQNEKTLIFCVTQRHAALVRDLVNQNKKCKDIDYCVRVTSNDGEVGEQFLRTFQDNEKSLPTVLTTSRKLSTGVDARNIRNIVLMRSIDDLIEFKQIIGRGTRLFENKEFFTIYDFVNAIGNFADPAWDGESINSCHICGELPCECKINKSSCKICGQSPCICSKEPAKICEKCGQSPCICIKKVKIKLRDGKEREIQHIISQIFFDANGKPISAEVFLNNLFGELPNLFKNEAELRALWGKPETRKKLLLDLEAAGFGKEELNAVKKVINAEKSDLYDVLVYISDSNKKPITRKKRVLKAQATIFTNLNANQKEFLKFVLKKYVESGVEELSENKLSILLASKYGSLTDGINELGDTESIRNLFENFQKHLYLVDAA